MRTSIALPMAGLLILTLAAPVAAGPNVTNQSGGGKTLQGEWYDEGTYGAVYLFDEGGYQYGELYESQGDWVLCSDGGTPDEHDDVYGFVGTSTYGYFFDLSITFGSKLSSASASGTAELWTDTIDECTGSYESTSSTEEISVSATGVGSVAMFRGMGSFKIPGEYNEHQSYRGKERQAAGTVDLGTLGSRTFDWAIMSEYSWIGHANG